VRYLFPFLAAILSVWAAFALLGETPFGDRETVLAAIMLLLAATALLSVGLGVMLTLAIVLGRRMPGSR
jgi:hypothetical protein